MKIMLLPGLDGTGFFFKSLIHNFPDRLNFNLISLDKIEGGTYLEQENEIAQGLDDKNIIMVSESYSGRIVYELCGVLGKRIK